MRPSAFNLHLSEGKSRFVFNAFTGALTALNEREVSVLKRKRALSDLSTLSKKKLIEGGFVIDEAVDEVRTLRLKHELRKYDASVLALTICPTLECNFACPYCFQSSMRRSGPIQKEVISQICRFVRFHAKSLSVLKVEWFGGEPLLEPEVILQMMEQFAEVTSRNKIEMVSSITTNGYFLTEHMAQRLKSAGVGSAQISVDGIEAVHNRMRPLKGGAPTYRTVIGNAIAVRSILDLSLRVNVSNANIGTLPEFLSECRELKLSDLVHIEMITGQAGCQAGEQCGDVLRLEDFSRAELRSFRELQSVDEIKYRLRPRDTFCGANTLSMLAIDPEGYVYKCWHRLGRKAEAIGHISQDIPLCWNHVKWLSSTPYEAGSPCLKCLVLPLCQGGCMHTYLEPSENSRSCSAVKHNAKHLIRLLIELTSAGFSTDNS